VTSAGVVSTTAAEDSAPEQFFDDFASVLAKHRGWDRETDSVPARSLCGRYDVSNSPSNLS
jgi:catalase